MMKKNRNYGHATGLGMIPSVIFSSIPERELHRMIRGSRMHPGKSAFGIQENSPIGTKGPSLEIQR